MKKEIEIESYQPDSGMEEESQSLFLSSGKQKRLFNKNPSKNMSEIHQNYNQSIWNLEENLLYKDFLKDNIQMFRMSNKQKKIMKINVQCSKYVKTRSSIQCRSHHQKLMKLRGDQQSIIAYIEGQVVNMNVKLQEQKIEIQQMSQASSSAEDMKEIDEAPFLQRSLWESILGLTEVSLLNF